MAWVLRFASVAPLRGAANGWAGSSFALAIDVLAADSLLIADGVFLQLGFGFYLPFARRGGSSEPAEHLVQRFVIGYDELIREGVAIPRFRVVGQGWGVAAPEEFQRRDFEVSAVPLDILLADAAERTVDIFHELLVTVVRLDVNVRPAGQLLEPGYQLPPGCHLLCVDFVRDAPTPGQQACGDHDSTSCQHDQK